MRVIVMCRNAIPRHDTHTAKDIQSATMNTAIDSWKQLWLLQSKMLTRQRGIYIENNAPKPKAHFEAFI